MASKRSEATYSGSGTLKILTRELKTCTIVVCHCSASDNLAYDDIAIIKKWHLARGFIDVGYHFYIQKNGNVQNGRSIDQIGAHVTGFNYESIGICLGGDKSFTDAQFRSAAKLIDSLYAILPCLKRKYGVLPHRFLNIRKTCPNFEMKEILKYLTVDIAVDKNGRYL